jgi:hypothetical protein
MLYDSITRYEVIQKNTNIRKYIYKHNEEENLPFSCIHHKLYVGYVYVEEFLSLEGKIYELSIFNI